MMKTKNLRILNHTMAMMISFIIHLKVRVVLRMILVKEMRTKKAMMQIDQIVAKLG